MSGERPAPLWPEGLRKRLTLPSVESQRTQAPASGDTSFVPKQEAGSGGKKPEAPKPQPSAPDLTLYERFHGRRRRSGVLENPIEAIPPNWSKNPGEQRAQTEQSQPKPAEQQAAERLEKLSPEGTSREVLQADELFQTIQELPFNRLLELNPEEYGFSHIGDMLLYMLVERRKAYFPGIYSTVSTRLEQEQHEAIEKVMGGHPSESNEELERTAFGLVDEKFLQVIQELGSHWRKQGRL